LEIVGVILLCHLLLSPLNIELWMKEAIDSHIHFAQTTFVSAVLFASIQLWRCD